MLCAAIQSRHSIPPANPEYTEIPHQTKVLLAIWCQTPAILLLYLHPDIPFSRNPCHPCQMTVACGVVYPAAKPVCSHTLRFLTLLAVMTAGKARKSWQAGGIFAIISGRRQLQSATGTPLPDFTEWRNRHNPHHSL